MNDYCRNTHAQSPCPIVAGTVLAALLALILPIPAHAQHPGGARALTEDEVVTIALRRAPLADLVEGNITAEQGRAQTERAYPNPEASYSSERTYGTADDYLTLSQSFDLGNKRGLRGQAGAVRAEAVRRDRDSTRLAVAIEARQRFNDLLYRQRRVSALEAWAQHVSEALATVAKRAARGDVATYDRRRLEREELVASARLASERAILERSRARLQAIIGSAIPVTVTGALLPEADPRTVEELRTIGLSRPDLLSLDLRIQASELEDRAAKRWWVPDLGLQAGSKSTRLPVGGTSLGHLVGVSLALPLWDRSRGLSLTAEGEARAARGERMLLQAELEGELAGARSEAIQLRQAAADFRERGSTISDDLVRMTSRGYEGGELGILELLDAYRGAVDDDLNALDMEHDARRSRIELDRLTGMVLP